MLLGANHSRFPVRDPGLEFTTSAKDIRHERAYEKDLPVTPFEIGSTTRTGTPDAAPLWSARGRTWELLGDLGIELGIERSNSGMVKTCDVN